MRQLGRVALTFLLAIVALAIALVVTGRYVRNSMAALTVCAAVVFAAYLAGSRWIERREPPELTRRASLPELVSGIALGLGLFSAVMGLLWIAGEYRPAGWGTPARLGVGAIGALLTGVLEETLFRGLLYRLVSTAAGTWAAVLSTSILFGAAHASNPGATLVSSVAIALEAGVLLAAAYLVTGRLWLPIGIHAGWNFAEGSIFGMAVSGGQSHAALFRGRLEGPTLLTGGPFGPEASVVAVIVCLAAAALMLQRVVRSRLVERPAWRSGNRAT